MAALTSETVQPGVEPPGIAKTRQLPPAVDQRLLDGVLGEVGVAEDQASERVEAVERIRHQHVERVAIAVCRALHELLDSQVRQSQYGLSANVTLRGVPGVQFSPGSSSFELPVHLASSVTCSDGGQMAPG